MRYRLALPLLVPNQCVIASFQPDIFLTKAEVENALMELLVTVILWWLLS